MEIHASIVLSPLPDPQCVCLVMAALRKEYCDFLRDFNQYCNTEDCPDGVEGCGSGSVLSMLIVHCFKMVSFACLSSGNRVTLLSDDSPVAADEEVLSASGPDGHHLIGLALKHLLYGSHFFMATYANVYTGVSVRHRQKGSNRYTHNIRKNTDSLFYVRIQMESNLRFACSMF